MIDETKLICDHCGAPILYLSEMDGSPLRGIQATNHFLECEKSPLYQTIFKLREENRELKRQIAGLTAKH